jgi:hypothetical protein
VWYSVDEETEERAKEEKKVEESEDKDVKQAKSESSSSSSDSCTEEGYSSRPSHLPGVTASAETSEATGDRAREGGHRQEGTYGWYSADDYWRWHNWQWYQYQQSVSEYKPLWVWSQGGWYRQQ